MCSCLGILLASLPQFYVCQPIYEYVYQFLVSNTNIRLNDHVPFRNDIMTKDALPSGQQMGDSHIDNRETALLAILHTFFNNAILSSIVELRKFLLRYHVNKSGTTSSDQSPLKLTIRHMYFLARLVGPVLNVFVSSPSYNILNNVNAFQALEGLFLELIKCMCAVEYSPNEPIREDFHLPVVDSDCGIYSSAKIVGKKRRFEEMNEGGVPVSLPKHSCIFPVLHMNLSQASLPINQQIQEDDSLLFEQVLDLMYHIQHLLYGTGQKSRFSKGLLTQEIEQSGAHPLVRTALINLINI
jgi:hypothetical protein